MYTSNKNVLHSTRSFKEIKISENSRGSSVPYIMKPCKVGQARIAQLVECPTEKPGAILTRVRVPSATRDISPRVNCLCRHSYGVRTAPVCINICKHVKIPNTGRQPLLGHTKILRTLIGMGSAALQVRRSVCLTQVRRHKFSGARDKEVLFLIKKRRSIYIYNWEVDLDEACKVIHCDLLQTEKKNPSIALSSKSRRP